MGNRTRACWRFSRNQASSGDGHGLDALRRLHKRFDPLTIGRPRSLPREILAPGRVKLSELQGAVERLEELLRRCCTRKGSAGLRRTIPEDSRQSSLEALLPEELEKHVQMNHARLGTYKAVREGIVACAEARISLHQDTEDWRRQVIRARRSHGGGHARVRARPSKPSCAGTAVSQGTWPRTASPKALVEQEPARARVARRVAPKWMMAHARSAARRVTTERLLEEG